MYKDGIRRELGNLKEIDTSKNFIVQCIVQWLGIRNSLLILDSRYFFPGSCLLVVAAMGNVIMEVVMSIPHRYQEETK